MSRALTLLVIILPILAGCATTWPPAQIEDKTAPGFIAYTALQQWLNLHQQVTEMPTEEVAAELLKLDKPEGVDELFYFGVLNQQLQTFASWAQARDSFRILHDHEELTAEQRQLADIFQHYNQNCINLYQRQNELLRQHSELQQQLQQAEQDKQLLEQKIQALTDLEAVISTRKEQ